MKKLIYLARIRPNLAYTVNMVSQFMHDPRERHLQVVERGGSLTMKVYTCANHAGLMSDRIFTLGYCTFLCENLIA